MDGKLSFVEPGRRIKTTRNEVKKTTDKKILTSKSVQCLGTRRANCMGWHFLGYFFFATEKEVTRQQAKKSGEKNHKVLNI